MNVNFIYISDVTVHYWEISTDHINCIIFQWFRVPNQRDIKWLLELSPSKYPNDIIDLRDIIRHNMIMNAISGCNTEQWMDNGGRTNRKIVAVQEVWIVIVIQKNGYLQNKSQLFHTIFSLMIKSVGFSLIACSLTWSR